MGKLLALGFEGQRVPPELAAFVRRFGLGGVILFARNCPDAATVRALTAEVGEALRDPFDGSVPLVLVDQEGGRVERIKDGVPRVAPALELSKLPEGEIENISEAQSRALLALGIDVNLAPVADVLRPGESGAIGDRAFGDEADVVAAKACAFLRGMRRAGIGAVAKHFPGHGASARDTHLGPGVVDLPRDELLRVDAAPFLALVAQGAPGVMLSHLIYPAVDVLPASLSPVWATGVLRGELGFGGAILTDDLEMGALAAFGTPGEVALRAVHAGADLLLFGRMLNKGLDPISVASTLEAHVPATRLEASVARAARLRPLPR